jgi:hypothetical protein
LRRIVAQISGFDNPYFKNRLSLYLPFCVKVNATKLIAKVNATTNVYRGCFYFGNLRQDIVYKTFRKEMLQLSANYAIVLMGKAREATYPQK